MPDRDTAYSGVQPKRRIVFPKPWAGPTPMWGWSRDGGCCFHLKRTKLRCWVDLVLTMIGIQSKFSRMNDRLAKQIFDHIDTHGEEHFLQHEKILKETGKARIV